MNPVCVPGCVRPLGHSGDTCALTYEVGRSLSGVRVAEPARCSPDAEENGCTTRAEVCTCTYLHGCGEDQPGCCFCAHLDVYLPCPTFGFGCGPDCTDEDCCTPYQRRQVFRWQSGLRTAPARVLPSNGGAADA